jgi:NADH-quinone oxidoreductase subunit M
MNSLHPLTLLTLIPLIGGLLLLCLGSDQKAAARKLGLAFSLAALGLVICLWSQFNPTGGIQFKEQFDWVKTPSIQYYLGIDGLGLLMIALTALVIPFALLASWKIEHNPKLYFALMLFLQSGLFGTFTALNFFHWFIFWELSLIPAFFLIKIWGGPQRTGAAYQFFVYTMAGSAAMLLAFLALSVGANTFDFTTLAQKAQDKTLASEVFAKIHLFKTPQTLMTVLFIGVVLGFAVKVPLIPFHTWLPGAYSEAPTSTSMVLTGVMSKMGVYGFLRIVLPIFPEQTRAMITPLLWLAVATIVFGAAAAFAQRDLKRIVAYSSINHLGYCLLGLFAAVQATGTGINGAVEKSAVLNGVLLQMFNHGLTASALFFFVGLIEQRSEGLRGLNDFGGLRRPAPVFAGLMGITLFASLGLPGLNGFVGEFLIFKGVFPLATLPAVVSMLGLLITAVFLLTLFQRVFCGPVTARRANWPDLTSGERWTAAPIVALMFVIGIVPQVILGMINPTVMDWVKVLSF